MAVLSFVHPLHPGLTSTAMRGVEHGGKACQGQGTTQAVSGACDTTSPSLSTGRLTAQVANAKLSCWIAAFAECGVAGRDRVSDRALSIEICQLQADFLQKNCVRFRFDQIKSKPKAAAVDKSLR